MSKVARIRISTTSEMKKRKAALYTKEKVDISDEIRNKSDKSKNVQAIKENNTNEENILLGENYNEIGNKSDKSKNVQAIKESNTNEENILPVENYNELELSQNQREDKYNKVLNVIHSLEETGFTLDEFSYNEESGEYFVYSSKDGKNFDFSSDGDFLNTHFEGYEGNECINDIEKIRDIAKSEYNLYFEVEEFEGKPLKKEKQYFNKSKGVGE